MSRDNILLAFIVAIFVLVLNSYLGFGIQKNSFIPMMQRHASPEVLYVHESAYGSFTPQQNGRYKLVLDDVDDQTMYYADRPYREAGKESTQKFVDAWNKKKDSFRSDPPNAVISYRGANESVIVEFLEATYDAESGELTYTAIPIGADELPKTMTEVSVFIDPPSAVCEVDVCFEPN